MSKDPAFLFYSADFLVGVMDLTDEETGQYIKLICLQHQKGRLKKESIYRMFPNISDCVLDKFEIDENGLYYNPRVEVEIEKRNSYIQSRSANGSKGGRPPKNAQSIEKPYGLAYEKHSENENINEDINDIDKEKRNKTSTYDEILSSVTDNDLKELYLEYIKMRKMIKAPMTDRALKMLINKVNELEPNSIENQKKLLEIAIMNNWKSVYPLRPGTTQSGGVQPSKQEEELLRMFGGNKNV